MDCVRDDEVIYLDELRTSHYEKTIDHINVHVYVKQVDYCVIFYEEFRVICKFSTKDSGFYKKHTGRGNKKGKRQFCYVIETRHAIDSTDCKHVVKDPYIEIILKKKLPHKWNGLHALKPSSPSSAQRRKLLGGKSTPMKTTDDKKQEDPKVENSAAMASSSQTAEDARNIKKAVAVASEPENLQGLTGLENYANNCYMNVVIQILANIQETRDYFRNDLYLKDVNANNPLSSGGKVAKAFAEVIKALWSLRKNPFKPIALKNIMGKRYSLFLGWQQHDAQEFFASLLDNLHEDVNQASYEKSAEKESAKPELESSVNEKPDTAWSAHVKRNNSFIVRLFHGQLMSKLTCAACHKVSYSYDPCASISLPIPTTKHNMKILFFTRDINKPPLMIPMQISTPNAKVWHLINMLQPIVKVPPHLLRIFNGTHSLCNDSQAPLLSVHKYKYVITSEISSKEEGEFISLPVFQSVLHGELFVHCDNCFSVQSNAVKLKRCTRCLSAAYCSRDCQTKHWHVHSKVCNKDFKMHVGVPFYVTLRKDSLTYETLESTLIDRAKFSVELLSTPCPEENPDNDGNNQSSDEALEQCKNFERLSLSAFSSCVIKAASKPINDENCEIINNETFSVDLLAKASYLIIEWQNAPEEGDISCNVKTRSVPLHDICKRDTETGISEGEDQCSVYDCLRLFMEPESLDEKDSWKCPKCKTLQSAKKEMALSSPPGVLLLHLKRFTYGDFGQKINKSVSYPLSNFDLSPFVAKETRSKTEHPLVYDLCGVITHSGSMRMGHYTCITRMLGSEDQEEVGWRFFDDDSVRKIKADKVVCSDAYVLVYRMQGTQKSLKIGSAENSGKRRCTDAATNNEKLSKSSSSEHRNCSSSVEETTDIDVTGASCVVTEASADVAYHEKGATCSVVMAGELDHCKQLSDESELKIVNELNDDSCKNSENFCDVNSSELMNTDTNLGSQCPEKDVADITEDDLD